MLITNGLASLAVRDLSNAADWYETLLGPARHPMPEVLEWSFEAGGGLQVYVGPQRAGQGSCTLIVTDIEQIAESLRASGLARAPEISRTPRVDTVMITDPDGNSIAFAAPKDDTLIH